MSDKGIHVGDTVTFVLTVTDVVTSAIIPITGFTTLEMTFTRPDDAGTTFVVNASLLTDGSDGKMEYTTLTTDLNMPGRWQVQGFVVVPSGQWHTSTTVFKVFKNL